MKGNKVILDTNIWISYFIKSQVDQLVDLVVDNELIVYSSKELVEELTEVLGRKKFVKYLSLKVEDYIDLHKDLVDMVETEAVYFQCPDPKDNFLFDLALQSNTKIIVTGDKVLLNLENVEGIAIISLTAFKEQF